MKSNYKPIGDYIQLVDERNKGLQFTNLLGISVTKQFIPSVANIIGTDMENYKIIRKNQFACSIMQVRRDKKMPVALYISDEPSIISQAYPIFEIKDTTLLLPEYLMMWFTRSEFDRQACFNAVGGVRGSLEWEDFCLMQLPIPTIERQREIVKEYNVIQNRIALNNQLIAKLEETAQTIYKQWFVDFEFPDDNGKPYKSNGGAMEWCEELEKEVPLGWKYGKLSDIATILMGQSPSGDNFNTEGNGDIFYQGRTEFGIRFPSIKNYTTVTKRKAKKGDILMSVRAPVGDLNIANNDCAIGRGIASIKSKIKCNSFLYYILLDVKIQFDAANDEGTIFGSITKDGLNDIKILIPVSDLILNFEKIISIVDKNIEILCSQLSMLSELNTLLLARMTKVESGIETVV